MAKSQRKYITLAVIGIGGYLLLRYIGDRTIRKISYGSPSISIWSLKRSTVEFRVKLPILNESDIPSTVTGFLGKIFYKDDVIGQLSLVKPVEIPGFGTASVDFRMEVGLLGLGLELYQLITERKPLSASNLKIVGTLKVNHLPIDINTPLI